MVDYAEDADFIGRRKPRKYRSKEEVLARRAARNAARSSADWKAFARDTVYRQLGVRDRSEAELRTALSQRDVPDEVIGETIAAFEKAGLVDDEKFARAFARAHYEGSRISKKALAIKLRAKGIAEATIQEVLGEYSDESEREAALEFALRKVNSMRGLDPMVAKRRLYGALARRGFGPSDIRFAVSQALDELSAEESNE